MKNKVDKQMPSMKTQKQNLITKFTPSTGLRLRVPLQWEPIQLILLEMVQMVMDSANQLSSMGKILPDLFLE